MFLILQVDPDIYNIVGRKNCDNCGPYFSFYGTIDCLREKESYINSLKSASTCLYKCHQIIISTAGDLFIECAGKTSY